MLDAISLSNHAGARTPPTFQRAQGRIRLTTQFKDSRTRLAELYQDGCAKVRLPNHYASTALDAVLLNTAGGLTGGDRITTEIETGSDTALNVATQACERIYRALDDRACVTTRLRVGDGARLHWLPQETILFDGGRLRRALEIELAETARLVCVEPVTFGRLASGEIVRRGSFRDSWRVRRGNRLVFADETRLDGALEECLAGPAVLAGAKAAATVLVAAPDAETLVEPAREILAGRTAGISAFDGLLLARLVDADSMALRAGLIPLLTLLRGGEDLPRAWHV